MIIQPRMDFRGYLSEINPPMKYPLERAAKNTLIKEPHTNMELPKYGANTRLPISSIAISAAPEMNAVIKRINRINYPEDGVKGLG